MQQEQQEPLVLLELSGPLVPMELLEQLALLVPMEV